jgi:hypothetical protein
MWIPYHVGLMVNELVDERARQAAFEGSIFDKSLSLSDFQSLARPALMRVWQAKWDFADTGRFTHSIFPDVTLRPWFEVQKKERRFVCTVFYLDIALFDRILVDSGEYTDSVFTQTLNGFGQWYKYYTSSLKKGKNNYTYNSYSSTFS